MPLTQRFVALLGCVLPLLSAVAQTSPPKLAPAARFELSAEGGVSVITDADLLQGHGTLTRPSVPSGQEVTRFYSVEFPVFHFATNEVVLRFVPKGTGTVRLRLTGFRDSFSDRILFKEEVYWHLLALDGAAFTPESLEEHAFPIKSWNQEPVELLMQVTKDKPIVLRASAQAVKPMGWQEMKPLRSRLSRAQLASGRFSKGVTLTRFLEVESDDPQRQPIAEADLAQIRSEGFDHVRLPVAWHLHLQKETGTTIPKQFFAEVERVIEGARRHGLATIVGFYGFNEIIKNPGAGAARFFVIWEQISQRLAEMPESLAFELLDEPGGEVPTKALMSLYAEVIPMIRSHSPQRTLFVAPSGAGTFASLAKLNLPDTDDNLIVTIDCADPILFTQQGKSSAPLRGVVFPGPPEAPLSAGDRSGDRPPLTADQSRWLNRYNARSAARNPSSPAAFRDLISLAKQWSVYYGRPVYFGELGCHSQADALSRARYYYAFRNALETSGIGWSALGWNGDFNYWMASAGQAAPGLKEALFATTAPLWVADRLQFNPGPLVNRSAGAASGKPSLIPGVSRLDGGSYRIALDARSITILIALGLLGTGALVWWIRRAVRRRLARAMMPLVSSPTGAPYVGESTEVLPLEVGRESLLRQLTRMMMETAIPRLVGQKRELIQLQERAAQDLAELDRRLEAMQAPLQNRLSAYQRRILELEHQLAMKGLENKELIQAKIQVTKERLEAARARDALLLSKHSLN